MKDILKLRKPIRIGDKLYSEFAYDAEEITLDAFAEADRVRTMELSRTGGLTKVIEGDSQMHVYLGFQAIRALNHELGFGDLQGITGYDIVAVLNIGRNFIMGSDASDPDNFDEPSENIPEPTAPVS